MVYQLKGNQENLLNNACGADSGSSTKKLQKGVNLHRHQWKQLDRLADRTGVSRNEALRGIIKDFFSDQIAQLRLDITISVLEEIHTETTEPDVREAANKVEQVILNGK